MKTKLLLLMIMLLVALPFGSTQASPALPGDAYKQGRIWTVYPHNSSPDDPNRIQAVIDLARPGDTVRLAAGTFDFSDFENVRIAKNLTIEGAWDIKHRTPLTRIKNGYMPILIGRKTPVEKPWTEMVNGHEVYHIDQHLWGKFISPISYVPVGTYDIFDDWTPVTVNVRQITFERPYLNSISSSATNGGTIERVRFESAWPGQFDFTWNGANGGGISWYNQSMDPWIMGWLGRFYDPDAHMSTDMISGNLVVQDSYFNGNYSSFTEGETDEAGDLVFALYDAANPVPPDGNYDNYVLQDVAFAWDEQSRPVPESIQVYWVKKGYAVYLSDMLYATRGIGDGIYSLFAQSNLLIRRNMFQNCNEAAFFVENGAQGVAFNAVIENNQIISAPKASWVSAFWNFGAPLYNPFNDQSLVPDPGENIIFRKNTIKAQNPNQGYWENVVQISSYGTAVVANNHIDMVSAVGIRVAWPSQGVKITANTITGSGDYALVADWDTGNNRMIGNNLAGFTPAGGELYEGLPPAEVMLRSDDNTVISGPHRPGAFALDLGNNNRIIGIDRQTLPEGSSLQQHSLPQKNPGKNFFR